MGEGLHCRAQTLPHLLFSAATTTQSGEKLFERTPPPILFSGRNFFFGQTLSRSQILSLYEPEQSILISDRSKKAESTFYSCHWAIRPHDLLATTIAGTSEGARGADSGAWLSHRLVLLVHFGFVAPEFTFAGHFGGRRHYALSPLGLRSHLIYVQNVADNANISVWKKSTFASRSCLVVDTFSSGHWEGELVREREKEPARWRKTYYSNSPQIIAVGQRIKNCNCFKQPDLQIKTQREDDEGCTLINIQIYILCLVLASGGVTQVGRESHYAVSSEVAILSLLYSPTYKFTLYTFSILLLINLHWTPSLFSYLQMHTYSILLLREVCR